MVHIEANPLEIFTFSTEHGFYYARTFSILAFCPILNGVSAQPRALDTGMVKFCSTAYWNACEKPTKWARPWTVMSKIIR